MLKVRQICLGKNQQRGDIEGNINLKRFKMVLSEERLKLIVPDNDIVLLLLL